MDTSTPDLARLYRESRLRIGDLVRDAGQDRLATPVPACPGWTVSDVVAHLAAVTDDVLAGRLMRPPTDEETADQVARFGGRPIAELLQTWDQNGPQFEELIAAANVRPALADVVAHEHDIRGALGCPGARDDEAVRTIAEVLLASLASPVRLRVCCDEFEVRIGPPEGEELVLRTDHFEAFRWRLGRRSRAQLAGMDWSGDPSLVLDLLVIFGPARQDVIE